MEKARIDWENLGFGYIKTPYRFVSDYKNGAWDEGRLTEDDKVVITECAGVLQYAQTCFEGLKAYTTLHGDIVCFRPDLNARRMHDSALRLEMPAFPQDKFVDAVRQVVKANAAYVQSHGFGKVLWNKGRESQEILDLLADQETLADMKQRMAVALRSLDAVSPVDRFLAERKTAC